MELLKSVIHKGNTGWTFSKFKMMKAFELFLVDEANCKGKFIDT